MRIDRYEKELADGNTSNSVEDTNRYSKVYEKKRSGCLFVILKVLFVMLLIITVTSGYKWYKQRELKEKELENIIVMNTEDMLDSFKNKKSDIDGWSQYDKIQKGLSPRDNSDTDGDGLTDREELEVYSTDPLKVSTSGDNIPDGYKIQNGLDVTEKIENKQIEESLFEQSIKEIKLKNKEVENFGAVTREVDIKVNGVKPVKAFRVESYTGEVEIDFTDWIDSAKNYIGFIMTDTITDNLSEVNIKDGKIEAEVSGAAYIGILEDLKSKVYTDLSDSGNSSYFGGSKALILRSPISELLGEPVLFIVEKQTISFGTGNRSEYLSNVAHTKYGMPIQVHHTYADPIEYETLKSILNLFMSGKALEAAIPEENKADFKITAKALMNTFLTMTEVDNGEWNIKFDESLVADDEKQNNDKPSEYISSFSFKRDVFPFDNFSTYVSTGGNCAGFANITTAVFNKKFYPIESSSVFEDEPYSYSIDHEDLATLLDKGLSDYKSLNYWNDTYDSLKDKNNITVDSDRMFLEFMGYKWAELNNCENRLQFWSDRPQWSTIEALKKYLASGDKIASLSMHSETGHAVNIYGMYQDEDNSDVWYLLIYDNNFPDNTFCGEEINNRMKITKSYKKTVTGNIEEYFTYDFYPVDGYESYRWLYDGSWDIKKYGNALTNTVGTLTNTHGITIYDENLNIIE